MNTDKILYWIPTVVICALMALSGSMYFFNGEAAADEFTKLGFPTWILIPLGIAKILGVIAILTNRSKVLKEWAYAGFFFDGLLAAHAHYSVGEGPWMALAFCAATILSRVYWPKVFGGAS
ncbi:MAG: DoxX family protein [Bacteroidota bacterium]